MRWVGSERDHREEKRAALQLVEAALAVCERHPAFAEVHVAAADMLRDYYTKEEGFVEMTLGSMARQDPRMADAIERAKERMFSKWSDLQQLASELQKQARRGEFPQDSPRIRGELVAGLTAVWAMVVELYGEVLSS